MADRRAPEDDRRDTVYQFADGNKGKTKTFAAMWAEMEGGGLTAEAAIACEKSLTGLAYTQNEP